MRYLRLSVTDHCNLRCQYCTPFGGTPKMAHHEILRYEEYLRLVRLLVAWGIRKVRITGGEPLLRRGIEHFLRSLCLVEGLTEVCLTTNGVLLPAKIHAIHEAGVRAINISLDTLDAKKYLAITSQPYWHKVWEGIETTVLLKDVVTKINMVVMKGINDDEIESFANLTYQYPLQVRFIEFMPIGRKSRWTPDLYLSGAVTMKRVRNVGELSPVPHKDNAGPAAVYRFPKATGEIGFISPLSNPFCASCNRIRITPDGRMRTCLLSDHEFDVKKYLRSGVGDQELAEFLVEAVKRKPLEHAKDLARTCRRQMSQIGG